MGGSDIQMSGPLTERIAMKSNTTKAKRQVTAAITVAAAAAAPAPAAAKPAPKPAATGIPKP